MIYYVCENGEGGFKYEEMGIAVRNPDITDEEIQNLRNIASNHLAKAIKESP